MVFFFSFWSVWTSYSQLLRVQKQILFNSFVAWLFKIQGAGSFGAVVYETATRGSPLSPVELPTGVNCSSQDSGA